MNTLNAQQLAFLLDIKKEDARARMCNAWEKANNIPKQGFAFEESLSKNVVRDKTKKIKDPYPNEMPIEVLATGLNLPTLQQMIDDIEKNYLTRSATKRYILFEYPEKQIKSCYDAGKPYRLSIPAALRSILPEATSEFIKQEWSKRFPTAQIS